MTSVASGARAVVWRLAVDLEMGTIEPERVVRAARQLLEMGVDDDAAIALAVMPSDLRQLRVNDVPGDHQTDFSAPRPVRQCETTADQ